MNINRLIAQTEFRRSRPDLWSRRDFLKTASTATLAALAAGAPRSLFASEVVEKIKPTADRVIVPVQAEYLALEGLVQFLETLDLVRRNLNPGLILTGVLITMHDERTRLGSNKLWQVGLLELWLQARGL